ncbi:MAG TPA: metallopeptidase family protein [Candidatus Acidoferrales bacterium]|nr:metallopeptidase family protein [Candidatus Acidoferrales bacterium]
MERKKFERLVEETLAKLPARYRDLLENVVIIVQDYPAGQKRTPPGDEDLLMGEFVGVPRTEKSVFEPGPPDQVLLYQKNIEAVCESEDEIREEVRLTVLHELGHYFGLEEDELEHL